MKHTTKPPRKSIFLDGRSWPLFHLIASLFLLIVFSIDWLGLGQAFDSRISSPVLFRARETLNRGPSFNPRVKILALDDNTFAYLGGPRLNFEQMNALLQNINARKPKAILIDSLLADTAFTPEQAAAVHLNAPIYSGSFLSQTELRYRREADLSRDVYQSKTYFQDVYSFDHLKYQFDMREGWRVYGHSSSYDGMIRDIGQITYNPDGTISPFYRLDENRLIPHLSLFAADRIRFSQKDLLVNDKPVPLSKSGRLMINHRLPERFYERTAPLRPYIARALAGQPETKIEEGDIVIILIAFATGNTDFLEGGPFGDVPGGLVIASSVSDTIDGSWIQRWEIGGLLILLFGFIGVAVGINFSILPYLGLVFGGWLTYSAFVIACFTYGSVWVPWILPMLAFTGTSLIHFIHVRIYEEMKLMLIERNYALEKARRLEAGRRKKRAS